MTATAPDLWNKREHKSDPARRDSKAALPCHDRTCEPGRLGARKLAEAEKRLSDRKAMLRNQERDKAWLADESTTTPNENKISHRWRGRALAAMEVL